MADIGALVAAAGRGRRLGAGGNKLFLLLEGKPILVYTLEALASSPLIDAIVVAVGPGEEEACRRLIAAYALDKVTAVVVGGETRQESVARALRRLDRRYAWVAVHDGARPFVSSALVAAVVAAARAGGAAVPGVPLRDTVKSLKEEGLVRQTLAREGLVAVQTPQVFARWLLEEAHLRAAKEGFLGTDDASLVERLGHPVRVVPGSYLNLKITTREDLALARGYLTLLAQGNERERYQA
ncbi:MAG: 2-C-methyl-D-erythritol 4-phosphate cytidylyltransferase [Clostridia bacterium]|nr:2-C-methyl-D-erythritol 4-phosphate cytidylyltransferase [Clostridia bacterium]